MNDSAAKRESGKHSSPSTVESNLPSWLTPMERLHQLRDSDSYPNAIVARLIIEGVINRELLEQSLQFVARRHEMMFAKLSPSQKRWLPSSSTDLLSKINWHKGDYDPNQHRIGPIRLNSDPGCVCDAFVGAERTSLFMQMHHARVDGLGAIQGIQETLRVYDNLYNQRAIDDGLRRLDEGRFAKRGQIGLFQKGWWRRVHLQWIPAYGAAKFALAKITHLLPEWKKETQPAPLKNYLTYCRRKLDPQVLKQLRAGDRTANDRLLAGVFLAIDRFQTEIKQSRGNKKIRIVVPISIRERADLRGTICNRVALIQLDRADKDFADPEGLAWGINHELGFVSKYKFEKSFGIVLRLMSIVPGFFRWRIKRRSVRTTTVLTNLGTPFRKSKLPRQEGALTVGDLRLVDVELIPPVHDLIPAVFLFSTFEERSAITINYDQRVLSCPQAERLLEIYFEEICRLVDGLPAS